jgi:hypothetical protein
MEYPFMLVRIAFFNGSQETSNQSTPGGEDSQTYHDEKDPLKDGEEKAQDSKANENPADDQNSDFFKFFYSVHVPSRFNVSDKNHLGFNTIRKG